MSSFEAPQPEQPPTESQGGGYVYGPDQTVGEQPAQLTQPVRGFKDLRDAQMSLNTRKEFDSASKKGDWDTANQAYGMMRQQAGQASTEIMMEGGDPSLETRPIAKFVHPSIEGERRGMFVAEKVAKTNGFVQQHEWFNKTFVPFMQDKMKQYKEKNEAKLGPWTPDTMTAQQKEDYQLMLQPVWEDPNVLADIRQGLVQMDIEGKKVDPNFSVFTHPITKKWAKWANREGGVTGLGYIRSREQEMKLGAVGRGALIASEAIEEAVDPIIAGYYQVKEWENMALRAIGLEDLALEPMKNYIEGPNGELLFNEAKPHPGLIDIVQGALAAFQGEDVAKAVARLGRVREMEKAQRHGLNNLIHGVANTAGAFAGFGAAGGAAMGAGAKTFTTLGTKGLKVLAGLGVKGAESAKALKMVELWGSRVGSAVGQGAFEATAYGKTQGYVNQFQHGVGMWGMLVGLGYAGNRTERFFQKYAKMPKKLAGIISEGMTMGVPFATMEIADSGLWEHLRNPNEETLQTYMRNILGAMVFRGIRPEHGMSIQQEAWARSMMQTERSAIRANVAKEVFAGERSAKDILKEFPTLEEADIMRLGEAEMRKRSETNLVKRLELADEQRKLEQELDIKEYGLESKIEKELGQIVEEHRPEVPVQASTERLKAAGTQLRQRGELEAKLEKQGRQLEQSSFLRSEDPMGRLMEMTQRRDLPGKGLQETGVVYSKEGKPIVIKGAEREVDFKKMQEAAGGDLSEVSTVHTHPLPSPASISDLALMAAKTRKGKDAAPDYIVTSEGVYEVRVKGEPLREADIIVKNQEVRKRRESIVKAAIPSIAKELGVSPKEISRVYNKLWRERAPMEHSERKIARRMSKLMEDMSSSFAEQFGLSIKKMSSKEASEALNFRKEGPITEARGETAPEKRLGSTRVEFPVEAEEGARQANLDDIRAEMKGRLPRGGVRVPLSEKRVGGKPGDPVRVSFRKGGVGGGKGVMGLFKIFENLVRTRGGRDLITDAHEWSHAMQKEMQSGKAGGTAFNEAAKEWVNSLPREVLAEFPTILEGYANWEGLNKARQGMEVWAEWHARELLGDSTLTQEAPLLSDYFRRQLAEPMNAAIREQFTRIRDKIADYKGIGAEGRLEASVAWTGEKPSESVRATEPTRIEKARDNILKALFDDAVTLKRGTEKWLEAVGKDPMELNIMDDPARLWDVLRMTAPKKAEHFVMKGIKLSDGSHVPGIRDLFKGLKGRERDFTKYAVALINAQRIMRGKKATLAMEDYVSEIKRLQTENPDFKQKAREMKAWTDTLVDWVAETGNLAPEQAQKIKDAYVVWMPFFRLSEGPQARGFTSPARIGPPREAVGKLKGGGTERIQDPMMAMFDAATSMISNAHRTMISSALYKLAVGKEAGGMASIVPKSAVPKEHPLKDIISAIEKQVDLPGDSQFLFEDMVTSLKNADALDAQTVTLFSQSFKPATGQNIIAFTPRLTEAEISRVAGGDNTIRQILESQQGKTQWMQVNPEIYETMMGLDIPPLHRFFEHPIMGAPFRVATQATRLFATGINVPFQAANWFRDNLSKPIFSQDGKFRPLGGFWDSFVGMGIYYGKSRESRSMRELYEEMGVPISSFFHEGTRRKLIGEARTFWQKSRAVIEKVESVISHPENYLRINEFKKAYNEAKAEGVTELEARLRAAEAGREITVNFARAGIFARVMNGMIPYFNAGLQGQRKVWRQIAFGGEGKNDAQKARIQRAAIVNGIANITMPTLALWWMNKDEEWYQDLPEWRKFGFFNFKIFGTVVSLPKPFEVGAIFGGIPEMFMEMWANENGTPPSMGTAMSEGVFPMIKSVGDFIPALLKPMVELTANYDFFRARPLTPQWIASTRIPEEQATFYTSETAKVLSKAMNGAMTPIELEKLIGGYTAGKGTFALRTLDELLQMKDHPGWGMNPFQRFLKEPHRSGFYQNRVYEISRELDRKAGSHVASGEELSLRHSINQVKRRLSNIHKAVQAGTMTTEEAGRLQYKLTKPLVKRYEELE